ncbi:MAG: DUF11 domain-containing protein [bacterium]
MKRRFSLPLSGMTLACAFRGWIAGWIEILSRFSRVCHRSLYSLYSFPVHVFFIRGPRNPPMLLILLFILLLSSYLCAEETNPFPRKVLNTATASFRIGDEGAQTAQSNTVAMAIEFRTPSELSFRQYAPYVSCGESFSVAVTEYDAGGSGDFLTMGAPVIFGTPLDISGPVTLTQGGVYHKGEPIFLVLRDQDQDVDPDRRDTVLVTIAIDALGEKEVLRLTESGENTGVFAGYIQTSSISPAMYDGLLSVADDVRVVATYSDKWDGTDTDASAALVDPYGIIFDSMTGLPVNGATITCIDADTGLPAAVFGDDGVSVFPSTVISGGSVKDSSGREYLFEPGTFRFPFIAPGNYRFEITPPADYFFPSTVSVSIIQSLPGAPFAIDTGSLGGIFVVNPGPVVHIDIPLDPAASALYVRKTASKHTASHGDFIQFMVSVENPSAAATVPGVEVKDLLPRGFRYQKNSTKINGEQGEEPLISPDGRSMTLAIGDLPAHSKASVSYVAEVAAGARIGDAENLAWATGAGGENSNIGKVTVKVRHEFMRSACIILGQVTIEGCADNETTQKENGKREDRGQVPAPCVLPGVRVYLENGSSVITDKNGMYHFEGVDPGVHVVQMDVESIPEEYQPKEGRNDRFAGNAFSRFVDLQAGTMWRADFTVCPKRPPQGEAFMSIEAESPDDGETRGYYVHMGGTGVPLRNVRIVLMLPEGVAYEEGSALLDAMPVPPEIADGALTFRIGDTQAEWMKNLRVNACLSDAKGGQGMLRGVMLFDTETLRNQRTPVAGIDAHAREGDSGLMKMQTEGAAQGKGKGTAQPDQDTGAKGASFDDAWLESAPSGFEWLFPAEGYLPSIPSIKVVIKHHPSERISLLLDGKEVDPLNFDTLIKNKSGTAALSVWRGIDLHEGDNRFEAVLLNSRGEGAGRIARSIHYSDIPVDAEVREGDSAPFADGKTPPVIAIRLTDKYGYPARQGIIGEFSIDPPYAALQESEVYQNVQLSGMNQHRPRYTVGRDGIALLRLQPTSSTGEAVIRLNLAGGEREIRTWLKPAAREWILVGLAQGGIGYATVRDHMEGSNETGMEEGMITDGGVAFFAKGQIKGKWLMTIAYDSERDTHREDKNLHQTIDPDAYYGLYGDSTSQVPEAASAEKLYLRIERGQFYALFGDYDTGLTVTGLSRYSRSLTGFKTEGQSEYYTFSAFVSETNQAFVKDEIRGNGTSGLYHLSRSNIVQGSDKVTIQTRDRFRSERIISVRQLTRHLDYAIDYETGSLYFKQPVMSKDEQFNPVYIVVDYESYDEGDRSANYGGRGAVRLMDRRLEIGATHIHEGRVGGEGNLYGVDVTYDLFHGNSIKAEVAHSSTDFGGAKRQGDAYSAEVIHQSDQGHGSVYIREEQDGFGLGQQNGGETGTQKVGVEASRKVNEQVTLTGQAYRHTFRSTGAVRDVLEGDGTYRNGGYSIKAGMRGAADELGDGRVNRSNQLLTGAGYDAFGNRLNLSLEHAQSVGGDNGSGDFPTRTRLGADYHIAADTTLFGVHEITDGRSEDAQISRIGLKTRPWSGGEMQTSMQQDINENGPRTFANLGLRQTWQVTEQWALDGSLDQARTIKSPGNTPLNLNVPQASGGGDDFTSLSLGATYTRQKWSWTSRVERLISDTSHKWGLFTGILGEPRHGLGLSLSAQVFHTEHATGAEDSTGDIRLCLAYRPTHTDWIILDRLDILFDSRTDETTDLDGWRVVNHLNANYTREKTQISLQYGARYVIETMDGDRYRGYTDLAGIEGRYDITKRMDVGIRVNVLHSWNARQFDYSYGPSVGMCAAKNLWVSIGYNITGFTDRDFSYANYTAQGPYLRFRFKIDQTSGQDITRLIRMLFL